MLVQYPQELEEGEIQEASDEDLPGASETPTNVDQLTTEYNEVTNPVIKKEPIYLNINNINNILNYEGNNDEVEIDSLVLTLPPAKNNEKCTYVPGSIFKLGGSERSQVSAIEADIQQRLLTLTLSFAIKNSGQEAEHLKGHLTSFVWSRIQKMQLSNATPFSLPSCQFLGVQKGVKIYSRNCNIGSIYTMQDTSMTHLVIPSHLEPGVWPVASAHHLEGHLLRGTYSGDKLICVKQSLAECARQGINEDCKVINKFIHELIPCLILKDGEVESLMYPMFLLHVYCEDLSVPSVLRDVLKSALASCTCASRVIIKATSIRDVNKSDKVSEYLLLNPKSEEARFLASYFGEANAYSVPFLRSELSNFITLLFSKENEDVDLLDVGIPIKEIINYGVADNFVVVCETSKKEKRIRILSKSEIINDVVEKENERLSRIRESEKASLL